MGEVLGNNSRAGLVLLLDLVLIILSGGGSLLSSDLADGRGRLDVDLRGTKLGVVEEEGGLGGGLLLEGDGRGLCSAGVAGCGCY